MPKPKHSIDYIFFSITCVLVVIGLFAFFSASLGVLSVNQPKFYSIIFSQLVLGLCAGLLALYAGIRIPYKFWRKHAGMLMILSVILTAMVFVPHVGSAHGGARRWISVFGFSFQPVEFLKIAFVMYLSAWLSWAKKRIDNKLFGLLPLLALLGISAAVLCFQPDAKSLILMTVTGFCMLFLYGTPLKYILGLFFLSVGAFILIAVSTPYLSQRISTYLHPGDDPNGSSYQIQQSLIAVGSGQLSGKGFGQSIQKFGYIPEPQGDSIFAIIGEEFGFIGASTVVILYLLFAMRGLWISRRAPDDYSGLLASGLVIMLSAQSILNIAAITGMFPLTGVPLVFMSQGGTSLMVSLGVVGIILGISRQRK